MTTDRERLIIEALINDSFCPYDHGVPLEGAYGPKTCAGGCYDEPGCEAFDLMRNLDEDVRDHIALTLARWQADSWTQVNENPDHPLHAWLAERDPEYKAWLAEDPWGRRPEDLFTERR